MLSLGKRSGNARTSGGDSLQRLKRQDLLELLLEQIGENERLQADLAERRRDITELTDLSERLKGKLDDKDEQIERLKGKLNDKDALIDRLKKRLDLKDAIIAGMMAQGRTMPEGLDAFEATELLEVEERAVETYLSTRGEVEPAPAEPEAAEPEADADSADAEPQTDDAAALEPNAADEPEPADDQAPAPVDAGDADEDGDEQ